MPPMVQRAWVEGSTGKNSLSARRALFRWPSTRPGSTRAVSRLGIDMQDAAQMFGAIDHQRAVDRLPALAGAAAAGQDRDAFIARDRHRGHHVVDRFRHDHADRLHLVDRGVGAVAAAAGAVEQHLALDVAGQTHREGGVVRYNGCREGGAHAGRSPWLEIRSHSIGKGSEPPQARGTGSDNLHRHRLLRRDEFRPLRCFRPFADGMPPHNPIVYLRHVISASLAFVSSKPT